MTDSLKVGSGSLGKALRLHQQKIQFAPGAPGTSQVSGAWDPNRNSGCGRADSTRPEVKETRLGAQGAGSCRRNASERPGCHWVATPVLAPRSSLEDTIRDPSQGDPKALDALLGPRKVPGTPGVISIVIY